VGGGDAEGAGVTAQKILAGAVQVIRIQQQALHPGHNPLARRRQTREALASADEQLQAQLILQLTDLAAHPRLRGVQRQRHLGEIELTPHGLAHSSQLLEVHSAAL